MKSLGDDVRISNFHGWEECGLVDIATANGLDSQADCGGAPSDASLSSIAASKPALVT